MNRLMPAVFVLLIVFASPTGALEPLSPEEQAGFVRSVHEIIGCESCHLPGQPDRVPRGEIPQVCGGCHPDQHEEYNGSVHLEGSGAVCADCHGAHDITLVRNPDSKAFRSLVCGTCHLGPKEQFDRGPHKVGMEKTGALACASCHNNHKVQHPTIALVEPACAECHSEDSSAFALGQEVEVLFTGLRNGLIEARVGIDRARALDLNTRQPEQTLEEAQAGLKRARMVWHSLQMEDIRAETEQALVLVQESRVQTADLLASHRLRRIGLGIAWVVILANILFLYLKKRRIEQKQDL